METPESIAQFLIEIAADIKNGKPIPSALDELEEALVEWREEFGE